MIFVLFLIFFLFDLVWKDFEDKISCTWTRIVGTGADPNPRWGHAAIGVRILSN